MLVAVMALLSSGCQSLRQGDLLFHVAESGNAITDVTPGMIDHVAICTGADSVVEAIGKGVVVTALDTVLTREKGYYIRGRVKGLDAHRSIQIARSYIGRSYDNLYLPDNEDIYCSELVQLSMVNRKGQPLFETIPMSFHDASGHITDYWTDFYKQHQMAVPEGEPGTNPGELSQRKVVKLRHKTVKTKLKNRAR